MVRQEWPSENVHVLSPGTYAYRLHMAEETLQMWFRFWILKWGCLGSPG